jgi:Capsular polysaccharide synthesis protein
MVPRTIWCLWYQGWENAPALVKACAASWRQHNPEWSIHYLSHDSLAGYMEPTPEYKLILQKGLSLTVLSEIIRLELLAQRGGIWVDGTVYCLRPLDGWIDHATQCGFFAFNRPAPDRMLSSWFLAAETDSYIIRAWRKKAYGYWKKRAELHHYYWLHRAFAKVYEADARFRRNWDATPKLSADGPHSFVPYEEHLLGPVGWYHRLIVETAQTPMLKLTHKIDVERAGLDATYHWLCNRLPSLALAEFPPQDQPVFSCQATRDEYLHQGQARRRMNSIINLLNHHSPGPLKWILRKREHRAR